MNKHIVIINGSGGAGKDSFCNLCSNLIPTKTISTVDKVKEAAIILDWDGTKTEENRKALSDIKDLSTLYFNHPYNYIKKQIDLFFNDNNNILFIHSREPKEIKMFVDLFSCKTLHIKNPNIPIIESNHADAETDNYNYDYKVCNDGTPEDLKHNAIRFINWLKGSEI